MNDIIKSIEDAQLKPEVAEFHVGDTARVYAKIREGHPFVKRKQRGKYAPYLPLFLPYYDYYSCEV